MTTSDKKDLVAIASQWLSENKGLRKPTINDVAKLAGVSKKTVSRVINSSPSVKDSTRNAVNTVINSIGYSPDPQARGLAFRHSFLVGMIYDNPNPQYIVNMQQGILSGLKDSGYELVVHPCDRNSSNFIENARTFIERQKLRGVILTPSVSEDEGMADMLHEVGCDYIRIASVKLDDDKHMLVSNDVIGGKAIAKHLCDLGHSRVAFITGKKGFRSSEERQKGFVEGLKEYGISLDDQYIIEGQYTFESGLIAGQQLLKRESRPTAIFAANDEMAAGALQATRMQKLHVPNDISIVGFDDFQIALNVWPRLTTVHSPIMDIGHLAAQRLLKMKDGDMRKSEYVDSTPWIIERESSGPPPKETS